MNGPESSEILAPLLLISARLYPNAERIRQLDSRITEFLHPAGTNADLFRIYGSYPDYHLVAREDRHESTLVLPIHVKASALGLGHLFMEAEIPVLFRHDHGILASCNEAESTYGLPIVSIDAK